MTLNLQEMPVRSQFTSPEAYQQALTDWQARNTLPTQTIIPPADGTMTALKPRQPSGHYNSTPPKP